MFILLFLVVKLCVASEDVFDIMEDLNFFRSITTKGGKFDMSKTFFSTLENYHDKANVATEKTYPWIAQVVHSRSNNFPYVCTAVCVHDSIFMTASRCIFSLKIKYTSVVYQTKRLPVGAIVVPTKKTTQLYDDIAFLVTEKTAGVTFNIAKLYLPNEVKRTDDRFDWFAKLNLTGPFKVVGYAMDKSQYRLRWAERPYTLVDLGVDINIDLCWNILTNGKKRGFHVPCYHSCNLTMFKKLNGKCVGYIGVEGAAVIHNTSKKVFGLAIWGPNFFGHGMPVGFSVVNSKVFQDDFECAKKVKNAMPKSGSYQDLCKL